MGVKSSFGFNFFFALTMNERVTGCTARKLPLNLSNQRERVLIILIQAISVNFLFIL